MKWVTRCYTPPLFFVYGPFCFTYLCIESHQCKASQRNFKENLGIKDILFHQKASNCRTLWPYYNDDLINNDLIGQKFLND